MLVPAELEEEAETRREGWIESYQPADKSELDIVVHAANTLTLLHECRHQLEVLKLRSRDKADASWDSQREVDAARLGKRIHEDPTEVSILLRSTRHGARWLIERWELLGKRLQKGIDWSPAQRELALDILGVDPLFRDRHDEVDLDEGSLDDLKSHRLSLVVRQLENLCLSLESGLNDEDEADRYIAGEIVGMAEAPEVETWTKNERYLSNRFNRLLKQLNENKREHEQALTPTVRETAPPKPKPKQAQHPTTMETMARYSGLAPLVGRPAPEKRQAFSEVMPPTPDNPAPDLTVALLRDAMDPQRIADMQRAQMVGALLRTEGATMTEELRKEGEDLYRQLTGGLTPPEPDPR